MTSLLVYDSHDYRADSLSNVTSIVFENGAIATFATNQFDNSQISTSVSISGRSGVNFGEVDVVWSATQDFSAASWTFGSFNSLVRFEATSGAESIIGSESSDLFYVSGADTDYGGAGDDTFFYSAPTDVTAGQNLYGGIGTNSILLGSGGFVLDAPDYAAYSVSGAGDVNGDGFDDLIVGSIYADPGGANSGAAYVVFGKAGSFGSNLNLSALNGNNGFKIDGIAAADQAGFSVAGTGDFNGDGFADIIIGGVFADANGTNSGAAYVVFGKAGGFGSEIQLSDLDGDNGFQINGAAAYDYAGKCVSAAGDINGDGFDDLIVGAPDVSTHGSHNGAGYVIFGSRPGEAVTRVGTSIANRINGGNFKDLLSGLGGNDTLIGWSGADKLNGGAGRDKLIGGGGADKLNGDNGNDNLLGGGGNDVLTGGQGHDRLNGGKGHDTASYTASGAGVKVSLASGSGSGGDAAGDKLTSIENITGSKHDDSLTGNGGGNHLNGGNGDDTLTGNGGNDVLNGGGGKDKLTGSAGADKLIGGSGNDTLNGGGGHDLLTGGKGRDVMTGGTGPDNFIFNSTADSAAGAQRDHINDFNKSGDIIDLSGIDAKTGVSGNQAFDFIGSSVFSHSKGELRSVNVGANSRVEGDVNGDGHADFSILVEGVHNLHAGGFML